MIFPYLNISFCLCRRTTIDSILYPYQDEGCLRSNIASEFTDLNDKYIVNIPRSFIKAYKNARTYVSTLRGFFN